MRFLPLLLCVAGCSMPSASPPSARAMPADVAAYLKSGKPLREPHSDFRVGEIGYFYALNVKQILDSNTIVSDFFIVRGIPTKGMVDSGDGSGRIYDFGKPGFVYKVVGTERHATVLGAPRTLFVLQAWKIPLSPADK